MWEEHAEFRVEYEADGTIRTLQNKADPYAMNWANDQDWALYYAYKYRAFCAPQENAT